MDHKIAVKVRAAERYLLGELTPAERDEYENHYFACPECAEEIRLEAALIDNACAILRQQPASATVTERSRPWWNWPRPAYALAATAVLLAVVAYQNVSTIPRLRREMAAATAPQPLTSFSFITLASRGAAPANITAPAGKPFGIYFDVPMSGAYTAYDSQIQTESGQVKLHFVITTEQAKDTVQLLISPGRLHAGNYVLVVRGKTGAGAQAEIVRYPFSLRIAE